MNDETTRLLDETMGTEQSLAAPSAVQNTSNASATGKAAQKKQSNAAAYAAGGAVVGAGVGAAVTASASRAEEPQLDVDDTEENSAADTETAEGQVETPTEEQVILANDEGIRYAHVDADSFSEAFAEARAQVGAGGVFEYEGRLYGTYTADEWSSMSDQERADYQSRVNEVAPAHHSTPVHHPSSPHYASSAATHAAAHEPMQVETVAETAEVVTPEPVDGDIRVLGVQAVQTPEGQIMNVAVLENNGDQALLVDVDNTGTMDVLLHDDNGDGMLQESEVYDISEAGIHVNDLLAAQAAQQESDYYYTSNDDLPDYYNEAETGMSV